MKILFSCLVFGSMLIFITCCQKQEPDPNKVDTRNIDVRYTDWEAIDMDGEFSIKISDEYIIIPNYPYYGKIPETAILRSKNNSKSIFSGLQEKDIIFTFLKVRGQQDLVQRNVLPDEEYNVTILSDKPGSSGSSTKDYDIIKLYFTVSRDSFTSKVMLDIRKSVEYGVFDEDPAFKGKDQTFFKNYLKDVVKVKHIVLKGVTMKQLEDNHYTDYNSLVKAFNIPE